MSQFRKVTGQKMYNDDDAVIRNSGGALMSCANIAIVNNGNANIPWNTSLVPNFTEINQPLATVDGTTFVLTIKESGVYRISCHVYGILAGAEAANNIVYLRGYQNGVNMCSARTTWIDGDTLVSVNGFFYATLKANDTIYWNVLFTGQAIYNIDGAKTHLEIRKNI